MSRRIPVLETDRLIIRELTMDDLESINIVLNKSFGSEMPMGERQRWLQWTVLGYEMFAILEQPHYGERAVISKETGEIIGAVGVVPYLDTFNTVAAFNRAPNAPATAEVGLFWAIAPAHQRKGFASEAARALTEYLFTHEKLGRVIATTGYKNLPSQKVMQKLGMTIQHLEEPQLPDQFVVGVLENSLLAEGERPARGLNETNQLLKRGRTIMPFANKFRAMMDFPFAGDKLDVFTVESVTVRDQRTGSEGYIYDVSIVLEGPGGQRKVRQALKTLFSKHLTTFSAYGNAYQLWFRKKSIDIESLGDKRYAVSVKGAGERIALRPEIYRFLEYLETKEMLSLSTQVGKEKLVAEYLEHYQAEIRRKVGRYDYKLKRMQEKSE